MVFMHKNCRDSLSKLRQWFIHVRHSNMTSVRRPPSNINLALDLTDPGSPIFSKEVNPSFSPKMKVETTSRDRKFLTLPDGNNNDEDGADSGISVISSTRDVQMYPLPHKYFQYSPRHYNTLQVKPESVRLSFSPDVYDSNTVSSFLETSKRSPNRKDVVRKNKKDSSVTMHHAQDEITMSTHFPDMVKQSQYELIVPTKVNMTGLEKCGVSTQCNKLDVSQEKNKSARTKEHKDDYHPEGYTTRTKLDRLYDDTSDEDIYLKRDSLYVDPPSYRYIERKTGKEEISSGYNPNRKSFMCDEEVEDERQSRTGGSYSPFTHYTSGNSKTRDRTKIQQKTHLPPSSYLSEFHFPYIQNNRMKRKGSKRRKEILAFQNRAFVGSDEEIFNPVCQIGVFHDDLIRKPYYVENSYNPMYDNSHKHKDGLINEHQTYMHNCENDEILATDFRTSSETMKENSAKDETQNLIESFQSFQYQLQNRRRRLSRDTAVDQSDYSTMLKQKYKRYRYESKPRETETKLSPPVDSIEPRTYSNSVQIFGRKEGHSPVLTIDEITKRKRKGRKLPTIPTEI